MNFTRVCFATLATLVLTISTASAQVIINQAKALAGGVSPGDPAGFPILLNVPGHYKLVGNLVVPFPAKGIEIHSPNVTLDLNGYQIHGGGQCTKPAVSSPPSCIQPEALSASGIEAYQEEGTVVRNGSVVGFAGSGILASNITLENVRVAHNKRWGVEVEQGSARISDSLVELNATGGIRMVAGASGLIERTRVQHNGHGIIGGARTVVSECLVRVNSGFGVSHSALRATRLQDNHVGNRDATVLSMGGNLDNDTPF